MTESPEKQSESQHHLRNNHSICSDLPSAAVAQPLHSECSKAHSRIMENVFAEAQCLIQLPQAAPATAAGSAAPAKAEN